MKLKLLTLILIAFSITACDRVGSDGWCEKMERKDKGDWTASEATDYARNCVDRSD